MGERLICIQEVGGSIPPGSTIVVLSERLLNKFIVRVSGFGISEMLLSGTRALIFNNLVVLSRASWVYDGFYVGCCDDFLTNFAGLNARLCQRIKQIPNVVLESVGVSPLELSRTSDG
jgi:hypothetical protein